MWGGGGGGGGGGGCVRKDGRKKTDRRKAKNYVPPFFFYKNSAEVDIAPAFGEITTACNVGRANTMHGFIFTATTAAEK